MQQSHLLPSKVIRAPRPVVCAFEGVIGANGSPPPASPPSVRSPAAAASAANALETPSRLPRSAGSLR